MGVKIMNLAGGMGQGSQCLSVGMTLVYASLVAIDGCITIAAAIQLVRFYVHNRSAGWTRQKVNLLWKSTVLLFAVWADGLVLGLMVTLQELHTYNVFHCMIGVSNSGFTLYFILNPIAACQGWICWSNACGFLIIAAPQIIFLATFLLLLSFWVDLCHQATDREDEEDEEEDSNHFDRLPSCVTREANRSCDKHRTCLPLKRWRVRGRQKFVVVWVGPPPGPEKKLKKLKKPPFADWGWLQLVIVIFLLTTAFAALIWYGTGDNPIDSATMAEIYADFFAVVVLLSGGGLATYGLMLYSKMCKVKTGKASADIRKVAGLAVAAVVCFSLRAILVLFGDISVINVWHLERVGSQVCPLLTFLYYLIGEAIPSMVILWVMREMPPRSRDNSLKGGTILEEPSENGFLDQSLEPDPGLLPQWAVSAGGRPYLVLPARSSSDIAIMQNEAPKAPTRAVASN